MLKEVIKVEVWDHNQDKEWIEKELDPIDDNEYWKGFKAVKVKHLHKGHTYDIRVVGWDEEARVTVVSKEGVTTGECEYF